MVKKYSELLGKEVGYSFNGLSIMVKIIDVRLIYNNLQFLIIPVNGQGEKWIMSSSVKF
jgi:hypothetical protein